MDPAQIKNLRKDWIYCILYVRAIETGVVLESSDPQAEIIGTKIAKFYFHFNSILKTSW